jgi:Protein of unknown function/AsmA-like C-terminal region
MADSDVNTSDVAKSETDKPIPRRRRHGRIGLGMVSTLSFAALLLTFAILSLSGRTIPISDVLRAQIEANVNARLGSDQLSLGGIDFGVGRDGLPRLIFSNLRLGNPAGGAVAQLNNLRARISLGRLLQGEIAASRLVLTGAQITLRRASDGSFSFGAAGIGEGRSQSFPDFLARIDDALGQGALSSLREVEAGGVVLTLEDARSGRIWQATNATLILRRDDADMTLSVASDVFNGTDEVAEIQISVALNRATTGASVGMAVRNMPAGDIALQAPALSWLGVLDAPISGSVRTQIDQSGALNSLAGTLDIGTGALKPAEAVPPVAFQSARTYFTFDPKRQRIDFSEIAVQSREGEMLATGHTYLTDLEGSWPRAFLGQFRVSEAHYSGGVVFQGPLDLKDVQADLRLRLDPFTVELAQVVAINDSVPVRATGRIEARTGSWHAAIDARTREISHDRVLSYWPTRVAPVTRNWLDNNLKAGVLSDVAAAFRFQTDQDPEISLSFEFDEGIAQVMKQMPPLTKASGRATMVDRTFALFLEQGGMTGGQGGRVDVTGSVFKVGDLSLKPAQADIDISASGPLVAALDILNNPPLRIMDRAKRAVTIADAHADAEAHVSLPLKGGIVPGEVDYRVDARLSDVRSDQIVPGRVLAAKEMRVNVTPELVNVSGPATLDGVALTADWRQPLGADAVNGSSVSGSIELSPTTTAAFGLPLPEGMIAGKGWGQYELTLLPDAPPALELTSDLDGLGLTLASLGWSKPPGVAGGFEMSAHLGQSPAVDAIALSAPGLALNGRLQLGEAGRFEGAVFDQIRVGQWLDASVRLTARGAGQDPAIALTGGRFDLRHFRAGPTGRGGRAPIDINLDGLVVSDSVTLSPVVGRLEQGLAGISGQFEGQVNGQTPVRGTLAPANAGTAVRIQSNDAGGVIRDAGLTPNARGGTLDLVLTPVVGAPGGTYDGQFLIEGIRLRKAPAMADLLDAISVVGLLDQLDGPGIRFETVDGQFRLTRERLTLRQAAAVGGSLGISADGVYDMASKAMDFQGVISPIYFVNGIGSILTRRGEGLFGFNYRMTGTTDNPNVGVNPLSILTPGIFRQIFRRPPPRE